VTRRRPHPSGSGSGGRGSKYPPTQQLFGAGAFEAHDFHPRLRWLCRAAGGQSPRRCNLRQRRGPDAAL